MMKRIGSALAALMIATGASAADYPTKPINFIVPFAAGGSNDIVARAIGKGLADAWGQPVLIDNRAGAGGVIGAEAVARAPNDGHTILLVSSTFTINQAIRKRLPYDTLKDFSAVAFLAQSPLLVTAAPKLPASSMKELIELAKTKPVTYASSGLGSINQIAAELIAGAAGIKLMHVPYRGGAPALNDLLGDHVDLYVSSLPQVLEIVRTGKAKALAVTSSWRSQSLPDVPTLAEAGLSGVDVGSWWGIVVPAGTPQPVIAALNTEINKLLTSEDMKRFLQGEGAEAESHDAGPVRQPDPQRNRALDQGRAPVRHFHRLTKAPSLSCQGTPAWLAVRSFISRSASWLRPHARARSAALVQVGFCVAREGNGAFRFIVAIDRKRRRSSACAGKRPAARMLSKVPYRFSRSAAPFGPTPRAPGNLSEGSPRKAMKSGTCSGSTPYRSRTSAGPIRAISPARTG